MIKRIAVLLLTVVLALSMTGCGIVTGLLKGVLKSAFREAAYDIADEFTEETSEYTGSETIFEESRDTSAEVSEDKTPTGDSESGQTVTSATGLPYTISGDGFSMSFAEVTYDDEYWAPNFTINLNNSTNVDLMFAVDNVIVNGCVFDPFWACSVDAGENEESYMTFDANVFSRMGLTSFDEVTFDLRVYNYDDYDDVRLENTYTIYPSGMAAGSVTPVRLELTGSEVVYLDDEDYTFVFEAISPDNGYSFGIDCYIENNTSSEVSFCIEDLTVNNLDCTTYWSQSLPGDTATFTTFSIYNDDLEDLGITNVSSLEFKLFVYDYSSDSYVTREVHCTCTIE